MKIGDFYFQVVIFFMIWKFHVNNGQSERPRGVSLSNGPLYSDNQYFTCLDGSLTIAMNKVNDDYCDCNDGTDEPGTSACPSGKFHCRNRGYRPIYIPSSRVNDGICDCCDGSDEYGTSERSTCVNTCRELGSAELLAKNKEAIIMNEGFEIRKNYIKSGLDIKVQRQQSLEKLKEELEQIEQLKDEKEQVKDEAERPEKELIDKHKAAWEEVKSKRQAETEREKAAIAFAELDKDQDGRVTFEEIQFHPELDPDDTNEFTPEEALSLLSEQSEVFQDTFADYVWEKIKDKYSITPKIIEVPHAPEPPAPPAPVEEPPRKDEHNADGQDDDDFEDDAAFEDDYDDDYDEEDDYEEPLEDDEDLDDDEDDEHDEDIRKYKEIREKRRKKDDKVDEDMPEYDSYTKSLIQIADDAREEYDEVSNKMKDIEKNISTIEKQMGIDLGMEHEFLPLQGECYEYSDREYTYKLCAFDKASQRSKSGGSETSLGKWGEWSGPSNNKYSEMKYTGGLKCWNGPDRSCIVKLKCGKENQLTGVSEPERCVYEYKMTSPSLCNKKIDLTSGNLDGHDEL